MSFLLHKVKSAVEEVESSLKDTVASGKVHTHLHTHSSGECSDGDSHHLHRLQSFAPQREGNNAKWYVDACGYMWAVSVALERAEHEIWILDWWLSPELYLRRPPAKNEQYRIDRMLFAAAKRGVQVNIIVYKEVTQALTLSSHHTKHWFEDNDHTKNINVLRHPDHVPDAKIMASSLWHHIKNTGLTAEKLATLSSEDHQNIYGMSDETILYWAHHEKLCIVDGKTAFMGGLDLCYGRWDTNQHSIADAHPNDLNETVFPGQDYNNARIMDFQDVSHWENNKLDRKYNSRMGWSDVSISLQGPVVDDLRAHFAQRWNFIYFSKYNARGAKRCRPINFKESRVGRIGHLYAKPDVDDESGDEGQYVRFRSRIHDQMERSRDVLKEERSRLEQGADLHEEGRRLIEEGREKIREELHRGQRDSRLPAHQTGPYPGSMHCQILRSCTTWSHGVLLEHSICNAYIETIKDSEHFVYIENQFFITATSDEQKPVENRIGAALVERILRAAKNKEDFQVIVAMPALPGFAGDIRSDAALGTRAIMEYQYKSINRGKHSIMQAIDAAGVDPMEYIRFYNLRSYDRLNSSRTMVELEQKTGVQYDEARRGYDQRYAHALDDRYYGAGHENAQANSGAYDRYQQAAQETHGSNKEHHWNSVSSCYMLGGEDLRNIPWNGDAQSEMDAFVSEELYIHSKILIADDRKVICGSANLNDRSQLGYHDSEIAVLIEDQEGIDSSMAGKPWRAARFAASLRRQIFRKHLGLIPPQDPQSPDANFLPVGSDPNAYDWGSREDQAVADPLAPSFMELWKTTARNNTEAFRKVFHAIPDDNVRNWKDYDEFYERHFNPVQANKEAKESKGAKPTVWKVGHVVADEFSEGEQGVREVKEVLSRVRGTLCEMPLMFLQDLGNDLAKEGLSLNSMTEVVYT